MLDRRTFLAAAAAAGLPPRFAAAFAQDPAQQAGTDASPRVADLCAAWQRARHRAKPLLVLVVPTLQTEAYARGCTLGALLQHAGDETLLDLALCELACASAAETESAVGKAATGARETDPLLLLVEPPTSGKEPVAASVLPLPDDDLQPVVTRALRVPGPDADAKRALAMLASVLHQAIAADVGQIASRADRNRATLDRAEHLALERYCARDAVANTPPADVLLGAAAAVRMAAEAPRRPSDRERLLDDLVAAVRSKYVQAPPSGARWAKSTGCGTDIEGPPLASRRSALGGPCGTGFIPPLGRRFLFFLSRDER